MAYLTEDQLYQMQAEILSASLETNPLLPYSKIKPLSKQLATDGKNIIKAINEVYEKTKQSDNTIYNFNVKFLDIIGNVDANPSLLANLKKIDADVLNVLYKLYVEVMGSVDPSITSTGIKGKVNDLNEQMKTLQSRTSLVEYKLGNTMTREALEIDPSNPNVFKVKMTPGSEKFRLFINSVEYVEDDSFTVDRLAYTITWKFTADKGGFDILDDFELIAEYYHKLD